MSVDSTLTETNLTGKVLLFVVDDDKMFCKAIENHFKGSEKYKVFCFNTGEKCMEHLSMFSPDIIILDYRLNDVNLLAMDGLQVLKEIKKINKNIEVVMLSGSENIEIATNSIKYGAFDYIVKNKSAFIRLDNILEIIVKDMELAKKKAKREKQMRLALRIGIFFIILITLSYFIVPKASVWLNATIILFWLAYILFFIKVNKQKNEKL